jgi:hypothetical protein
LPWVGAWIGAHPLLATLAVLAVPLAIALLRGPRRDGVRSAVLLAALGLAFAAWQAPAPRFLFAFVLIAPVLAVTYPLSAIGNTSFPRQRSNRTGSGRAAAAFLGTTVVIGLGYAIASQKLNVRSAIASGAIPIQAGPGELLLPAAPKSPAHLYMWRVNDIDLVTPVPRPIADTLSFYSAIDDNTAYEQCSTAPLPCTPYVPSPSVRLRAPQRGLSAGFVHVAEDVALTATRGQCVGELLSDAERGAVASGTAGHLVAPPQCGPGRPR